MKTYAALLTAIVTVSAATAASAGQINRGSSPVFRHALSQKTTGYALTGEQTAAVDRIDYRERTAYRRGGRNVSR